MDFGSIPGIISSLAGTAVAGYIVLVFVDVALGVLGAIRAKTFDPHKLPSFLSAQFGTKQALVVAGLAATAYFTGGDAHAAVLAAITAGGSALAIALIADIAAKLKAIVT